MADPSPNTPKPASHRRGWRSSTLLMAFSFPMHGFEAGRRWIGEHSRSDQRARLSSRRPTLIGAGMLAGRFNVRNMAEPQLVMFQEDKLVPRKLVPARA